MIKSNSATCRAAVEKVRSLLKGRGPHVVAVLGLSFKPETDDTLLARFVRVELLDAYLVHGLGRAMRREEQLRKRAVHTVDPISTKSIGDHEGTRLHLPCIIRSGLVSSKPLHVLAQDGESGDAAGKQAGGKKAEGKKK